MRRAAEVEKDSPIAGKIEASHLSEHETRLALDAMHHADLFADGLLWTLNKLEHLGEHWFGRHPVRH